MCVGVYEVLSACQALLQMLLLNILHMQHMIHNLRKNHRTTYRFENHVQAGSHYSNCGIGSTSETALAEYKWSGLT